MATVAHYIYSHYDPPKPDDAVKQTADGEPQDEPDPWQTESAFGATNRLARAPQFVAANIPYDQLNNMIGAPATVPKAKEEGTKEDVASWYRSLPRSNSTPASGGGTHGTSSMQPSNTPATPIGSASSKPTVRPKVAVTKSNWFIRRALQSEAPSAPATPHPTLADILSRDPPAASKEQALRPPVFLALGPSNRGFTMLERSGWSEGEPLGPHVVRRGPFRAEDAELSQRVKREDVELVVRREEREVSYGLDGDVSEVKTVEVVDLTLSDSEDEEDEDTDVELNLAPGTSTSPPDVLSVSHDGRALLTPITTVLKSDRLGIGLKAKTEGPYRASKKRVTHNQAALGEM